MGARSAGHPLVRDRDRDPNPDRDRDRDRDPNPDRDRDRDRDPDRDPNPDRDPDRDPDIARFDRARVRAPETPRKELYACARLDFWRRGARGTR